MGEAHKHKEEMLDFFPELKAVGAARLNELAQEWLVGPVAKECCVSHLKIFEKEGRLAWSFSVNLYHQGEDGEYVHFPADRLLQFLIENTIEAQQAELLLTRMREARKRGGKDVFQNYKLNFGQRLPMYVECKNGLCGAALRTAQNYSRKEFAAITSLEWNAPPVECPACGASHSYDQRDLRFLSPGMLVFDGKLKWKVLGVYESGRIQVAVTSRIHPGFKPGVQYHYFRAVMLSVSMNFVQQTTTVEFSDG